MKKTAKRLLALLLTVVMIVPAMVVSTSAAGTLIPEMNLDFTDYEVDYNSTSHTMASKYLSAVNGQANGTQKLAMKEEELEDGSTNRFLQFSGGAQAKSILKFFGNEGGLYTDNYQLSFSFRLGGDTYSHYLGFQIRSDNADANKTNMSYFNYGDDNKLSAYGNANAPKLTDGEWYTITIIRCDSNLRGTLKDAAGNLICEGKTVGVGATTNTNGPAIRFMVGENNNAEGTYTVDIDNITWKPAVDFGNKNVLTENFDALTTGQKEVSTDALKPVLIGNLKTYSKSSLFTPTVVKAGDNQYLQVKTGAASNFLLYPANFSASKNWTMTFDFMVDGAIDTSKHLSVYPVSGIDIDLDANNDTKSIVGKSSGLDVGGQIATAFTTGEWYTVKVIRTGAKLCWMAYKTTAGSYNEADATERGITWTGNLANTGTKDTIPGFKLMSTVDGTISIDNVVFENTNNAVTVVGGQTSNTVAQDGTYAVRFVAAVNDLDIHSISNIGLRIKATYTDPETDAEVTKYFTRTATEVYDCIIGNAYGITETYSAAEMGGEKLIALGVHGIPTSVGTVKFEVTTVGTAGWGENTSPRTVTYTANAVGPNVADCYVVINNGTVELVDELPA